MTSTEAVLKAAQQLHAEGKEITRQSIQQLTRLVMTKVDDRLKHLVTEEKLHRPSKGLYVLAPATREKRAVKISVVPAEPEHLQAPSISVEVEGEPIILLNGALQYSMHLLSDGTAQIAEESQILLTRLSHAEAKAVLTATAYLVTWKSPGQAFHPQKSESD